MNPQIYILVVEDELEVMDALVADLESFEKLFPVETANTAEEAEEVIQQILDEGNFLGLILCDHVLPGKKGVDLLVELQQEQNTNSIKKVLVTGQAGLEETVEAVNKANLSHYIAKPWTKEELHQVVVKQLTGFVIDNKLNPLPYMSMLDAERLSARLRDNPPTDH